MRQALLAVALLLLLPAAASAKTVDVPELFQDVLPEVNEKTEVPVLLPQRYRSDSEGHFPSGEDPHYTREVRLTGGAHAGTKKQERKRLRQMANSAIRHGAR